MIKKILVVSFLVLFFLLTSTNNLIATNGEDLTTITSENTCEDEVYLEINSTKNVLSIYLNGYVAYSFPIATGRKNSETPRGTFHIVTKVENPWYLPKNIPGGDKKNPLGTRWLGLSIPNTVGYKYGIHGTNNPYSIGNSVSLGCIRMLNKDVEWLFRHIPLHTRVVIK